MAVVVENEYDASEAKITSFDIASVVVPTSSQRAIYVLIGCRQKDNAGGAFATAVTWDSAGVNESFTLLGVTEVESGTNTVAIWRLLAPTEKTAIITVAGADNNWSWDGVAVGIQVLSSVDQTTPEDTAEASSTGNSSTPAHTVTSDSGDYVVDIVSSKSTTTMTENGDGVEIWQLITAKFTAASADLVSVGNASMGWTTGDSTTWAHGGVSVNPAAAAAAGIPPRNLAALQSVARMGHY